MTIPISDTTLHYIILTLCITFTVNFFLGQLFRHIDKDPKKILHCENTINDLVKSNYDLVNKTKKHDNDIDKLKNSTNESFKQLDSLSNEVKKLSKHKSAFF